MGEIVKIKPEDELSKDIKVYMGSADVTNSVVSVNFHGARMLDIVSGRKDELKQELKRDITMYFIWLFMLITTIALTGLIIYG